MSYCSTNRPLAYFARASVPKKERKKVFSNIDTSTTMLPPVSEKRHQDIFFANNILFSSFPAKHFVFAILFFFREKIPTFFGGNCFQRI
jgi:hypothetical protein